MLKFLLITKGLCIIYIFSLVNMFFSPNYAFLNLGQDDPITNT